MQRDVAYCGGGGDSRWLQGGAGSWSSDPQLCGGGISKTVRPLQAVADFPLDLPWRGGALSAWYGAAYAGLFTFLEWCGDA